MVFERFLDLRGTVLDNRLGNGRRQRIGGARFGRAASVLPRAQGRLEQALELDPHDSRTLVELARVYEAMKRPDRAVALYERVLERNPKQTEVTKRLKALQSQGTGQPQPD